MQENIANFIEEFHRALNLEDKLHVLAGFFSEIGVEQACFINASRLSKNRFFVIGDFNNNLLSELSIEKMTDMCKLDSFVSFELNGALFHAFAINDVENLYGFLIFTPYVEKNSTVLRIVKEVIVCGIRNCEVNKQFVRKTKQVEIFKLLSNKVSGYHNLKDLLKILSEHVTSSLNAKGTVIRLVNNEKNLLEVMAEFGLDDVRIRRHGIIPGDGVSGEVWSTGMSRLVIPDTEESVALLKSKLNVSSLICVPLVFENEIIGTISVYEKLGDKTFEEEDKNFLEALGSLIAPVIAYTATIDREKFLKARLEKHLKDLTLITEINKVLMEPRRLDSLLHIVLTTLTFGEEIGFNRAVLFMYNENTGMLQGMMGVGCETIEETYQVWQQLPKEVTALTWIEKIKEVSPILDTSFNQKVKSLRFLLGEVPPLKRVFESGKIVVNRNTDDNISQFFGVNEYALVPLYGRNGMIGILYVDNKFTQRSISEDYITLLDTFASQAAIAIENSKLYNELQDTNDMLKTARQELLVKEKLAVVGEMLTTLAHEIRNPLTAIGGFAKILDRRIEDTSHKVLLEKIISQAERMNNIFNNFLYLAKNKETKKAGTCNIEKVLKNSINNLSFFLGNKVRVSFNIHPQLPCVKIDESLLTVVFDNLIKNAIQAMPDGGTIFVRSYQEGDNICIVVEDEGKGIPKDVLPHIFDPFYTTKFSGVGVGLSVTFKIIKQNSGIIYAENIGEGKGARFVIKLPLDSKNN